MIASAPELAELANANRAAARRLGIRSGATIGVAVGVVVLVVLGIVVSWPIGIAAGVVLGAVAAVLWVVPRQTGAVGVILSTVGARAADDEEFPRYANLIEGLGISAGVDDPDLYVIDEEHANLMVLGSADGGTLVATTGLLSNLGRVELEGVLAEGLYRIRVNEAELATQAAVFLASGVLRAGPRRSDRSAPRSPGRAVRSAARLAAILPERGHMIADLCASGITRFPPGLRDGLAHMQEVGTAVAVATWGTAHLWMCDPLGSPSASDGGAADTVSGRLTSAFANHPPLQHRIDLLAEL